MKNKRNKFRKKQMGGEKINYENGDEYDGYIFDGKREGKGKLTYINGDIYYGEWKDDKKHGQGKMFSFLAFNEIIQGEGVCVFVLL